MGAGNHFHFLFLNPLTSIRRGVDHFIWAKCETLNEQKQHLKQNRSHQNKSAHKFGKNSQLGLRIIQTFLNFRYFWKILTALGSNSEIGNFVKLQAKVQTSVLGLGVDFVLPLSQQEQQEEEPPPKSIRRERFYFNWSLTLKTKSCKFYFPKLIEVYLQQNLYLKIFPWNTMGTSLKHPWNSLEITIHTPFHSNFTVIWDTTKFRHE